MKNKMNLIIISNGYPSEGKPVYTFVEKLAVELCKQNVNITIIAPQSLTTSLIRKVKILPYKNIQKIDNNYSIKIYRPHIITIGDSGRFLQKFVSLLKRKSIIRVIKSLPFDDYILYGHFWHNAIVVSKYSKNNKIPLFVADGQSSHPKDSLKYLTKKNRYNISKSVTGVISVSSKNKKNSIDYNLANKSDIVVLPNAVDHTIFYKKDKKVLRKELNLNDDKFVIAFVGGFTHRKGPQRLADAVNMIEDDTIRVLFIGKPLPGDTYIPKCKYSHYVGSLQHDRLPDYLNAADIFVLPTLNEGCCNAIVEATACGLPVISSNLSFNDEILNDKFSIRVNPLDIEEISDAIRLLKDDKFLRAKMSESALEFSKGNSIERRANDIINFIQQQINKKNRI